MTSIHVIYFIALSRPNTHTQPPKRPQKRKTPPLPPKKNPKQQHDLKIPIKNQNVAKHVSIDLSALEVRGHPEVPVDLVLPLDPEVLQNRKCWRLVPLSDPELLQAHQGRGLLSSLLKKKMEKIMYEYDEWKILEIPWVYKKNFTLIILYLLHWFFFKMQMG